MNISPGEFYKALCEKRKYAEDFRSCIEKVVGQLLNSDTTLRKPGILLGQIQGGKTRTFLGIIALCFDSGYDIAIVLTKNSKPLVEQTVKRLHEDFGDFEDENKVQVHDIMFFPKNMVPYELNQKLIIVAKKETHNLDRIFGVLTDTYPDLQNKRILFVDDEADFASIGFRKSKETGLVEQGAIAEKIDAVRARVKESNFLQVTATPYSLYLQPDTEINSEKAIQGVFLPKKPAFTELVPVHENYVGGDYYFIDSQNDKSSAAHVYQEVPEDELEILRATKKLKRADRRSFKIEEVFESPATKTLRSAIMNFVVGGCVRQIQQREAGQKQENYSFVIHTERAKPSHSWQEEMVQKLSDELAKLANENKALLEKLVRESYEDLSPSIKISGLVLPSLRAVFQRVVEVLAGGMPIEKVNSDTEVKALLDSKGQLRLRTPLNIFIGGQALDRGVTIRNMIGFYYGRSPKGFQQDTVLQHSRMYGARSKEDLAVTRFYTTQKIYEVMRRIHEFDNALREAFLSGEHEKGVYFIRKDENGKLVPCAPNKIMLSSIVTLKARKRFSLPIGFQTDYKTKIKEHTDSLSRKLDSLSPQQSDSDKPFMVDLEMANEILDMISKTVLLGSDPWNPKLHKACLEHLSKSVPQEERKGKVWLLVRKNRDSRREREKSGRFSDSPDTGHVEGKIANEFAVDVPILMLFRQNGLEEQGWRGYPFWWPVIFCPQNTQTAIFESGEPP